jgi:predicted transcriptional regulator
VKHQKPFETQRSGVSRGLKEEKLIDYLLLWKFDLVLNLKLNSSAASERGRTTDQLVHEIVEAYLNHDKWFRAEVQKGLAQLDNEESVSDDEIVTSIQRLFQL